MRTLHLGLGGKCDCHCIFCSRGADGFFETVNFDYKDEYRRAARHLYLGSPGKKTGKLVISRDEPANHPYILNVLKLARKAGFASIELNTSGLALADKAALARLLAAGVTSVVIPVYGVTAGVHDRIAGLPGAFKTLHQAIKLLKNSKAKIYFKTILLKQNLHEIERIVRRYRCGVSYPFPTVSAVPYKDLCVRFSEISGAVRKRLDLRIPCVTGKAAEGGKFDDMVFVHTLPGQTQASVNKTLPSFKPRKCRACRMRAKCEGLFPEYVKLFGDEEFKPL